MKSLNKLLGKYVFLYLWITYFFYLAFTIAAKSANLVELYTVVFLLFASISFYLGCLSVPIPRRNRQFVFYV